MAYAAGRLDEPVAVVVACHLAWCPCCRRAAATCEAIGGALLACLDDAPLSEGAAERAMARLDAPPPDPDEAADTSEAEADHGLPGPLIRMLSGPLVTLRWKRLVPGMSACRIPVSQSAGGQLMLLRMAPGKRMPKHGHCGSELTLVLRGAYRDAFGRFGLGDIADHGDDVEHQPVVEEGEPCICLMAAEGPMRFRNPLLRMARPVIGL